MAVYINFVCDHQSQTANKRCLLQSVNFDALSETWGNMVDAMKEAGWELEL